eukprot:CAMPEP_0182451520 /NCGR_PEP_ID=MMETSP1172-20130603/43762_1 /TAXON_ID=708627 /ORGANISM="Timspurckia oligopyrenoides, Strain CCMP3278" /LENGTH=293 /DNA_ID=CAMNT_0024649301 /DNA_START=159 /DNA_END=1040 /DNA_ORIENTATION=+
MGTIENGWFREKAVLWPGQQMCLEVETVLYEARSEFQDVLVFKSVSHGVVLVLDGVIQVTERDEFSYQEMITHIAMYSHANPERVLVVGGGDGGVLREVLRHPSVIEASLCEIDQDVITVSKKYLPTLSSAYQDPRVSIHIQDGAVFMESHQNYFDIIITDSSDPVGPADVLFKPPYFEKMNSALRESGIICSQGECIWLHLDLIRPLMNACKNIFPVVDYAFTTIPTYPSGQIGFVLCSKSKETEFREPKRCPSDSVQKQLKYYNPYIHRAAFILPEFARRAIHDQNSNPYQ